MSSRWLEMICACQIKATHMTDIIIKQTASTRPFCDSEAAVLNFGRDQAIVIDLPVLLINLETATSIAVRSATTVMAIRLPVRDLALVAAHSTENKGFESTRQAAGILGAAGRSVKTVSLKRR
jgi:hypothetical protein